jgi:hypothetical protein
MHRGKAAIGPAAPAYRTGRYSKLLPRNLRGSYEQACQDQELLSVRGEVALVQARLDHLVARLHSGEAGSLWRTLKEEWAKLEAARRMPDGSAKESAMRSAICALAQLIEAGAAAEEQWADIIELGERKGKLAAAEWRRLGDLKELIPKAQVITMMTTLCHFYLA